MNKYLKIDCFTGLKIPNLMLYVAMFLENVSLPVQNTDTFSRPYTAISRNVVGKKCARDNPEWQYGM